MTRPLGDPQKELRLRVERILAGGTVVDDLVRIFAHFRSITKGQAPAVKDVADFQAHREGRKEGEAWKRGRDYLTILSFKHYYGQGRLIATDRKVIRSAFEAGLRVIGPVECRRKTGFTSKKALSLIASACTKVRSVDGPVAEFRGMPTDDEADVVSFLLTYNDWDYAFNRLTLASELAALLVRDGLLAKSEIALFTSRDVFIALYAVYVMHGQKLKIDDREHQISLTSMVDNVAVHVIFDFGKSWLAAPVFSADCSAKEWLHPALLEKHSDVDAVIEMAADGRLVPFGTV